MLKNVENVKNVKKCQKFKKVTGPMDQPTDQGVESRARD